MAYFLKNTNEPVDVLKINHTSNIPKHLNLKGEFQHKQHALVVLPPQHPGHTPRIQVVRWENIKGGKDDE